MHVMSAPPNQKTAEGETVFRILRSQRLILQVTAAVMSLAGIAGVAVGYDLGPRYYAWLILAAVTLPIAGVLFNAQAGKTIITADGIKTWQPLRRRSCRWEEVSDITCRSVTGRGSNASYVVIHRARGRSFKLAAPAASPSTGYKLFDEQLAMIRGHWDAAAWRNLQGPGDQIIPS